MALILYSNGILEEYRPANLVFTENDILNVFEEYQEIKTKRIASIVNTWCVFGEGRDFTDFNRIASDLLEEEVYSHVMFIHDSEINPKWNATDSILYKSYNDFLIMVKKEIDKVAYNILSEMAETPEYSEKSERMPSLITLGATEDKKILFEYNPIEQSEEFYSHEDFYKFSKKVYQYLLKNKPTKEPFTIYSDKKAIIIIDKKNVSYFLTTLLEKFKSKEEYEICEGITKMINTWNKPAKKPRKKVTRSGNINNEK